MGDPPQQGDAIHLCSCTPAGRVPCWVAEKEPGGRHIESRRSSGAEASPARSNIRLMRGNLACLSTARCLVTAAPARPDRLTLCLVALAPGPPAPPEAGTRTCLTTAQCTLPCYCSPALHWHSTVIPYTAPPPRVPGPPTPTGGRRGPALPPPGRTCVRHMHQSAGLLVGRLER